MKRLHFHLGWRVPILMYHRVVEEDRPDPNEQFFSIPVARFEEQMCCLHERGYQVIPLDRVLDWLQWGRDLPPRPVVITFDDGYEDTFRLAAPILERYRFPATIFVVTDFVGASSTWNTGPGCSVQPLMTWEQVRQLSRRGFTIGSHTRTHPRLAGLEPARLRQELTGSRRVLEEQLGIPVRLLSYPFNRADARTFAAAAAAGYRGACAGDGQGYHRWCLDRVDTTHATPPVFLSKVSPWFYAFRRMRWQLTGPPPKRG